MVNAFPAIQLNTIDLAVSPQTNIMAQVGGIGLTCQNGVVLQDIILAAASTNVALLFPTGISTAVFIYISSITTSDLVVKVGSGSPVALPPIPYKQGMLLYGLTSAQISLNTVLGGQVQYAIGG